MTHITTRAGTLVGPHQRRRSMKIALFLVGFAVLGGLAVNHGHAQSLSSTTTGLHKPGPGGHRIGTVGGPNGKTTGTNGHTPKHKS